MTVYQPDTTSLHGRMASLMGRKVSRPDARKAGIAISNEIVALSHLDREAVLRKLGSSKDGLEADDAAPRLRTMGANSITQEEQPSIVRELLGRAKNPLKTEIVLPELLAAALEANDRAKVRMTLRQEAVIHAENPISTANTLDRQRRSAGLEDAILNSTVKNARALGSGRFDIPGGQMLLKGLYKDIEVMMAPVMAADGETAEAASKRLTALRASSPEAQGDVMTQALVARITSARAGGLDSEHLLIMDLHEALNRLSAAMATEIIAGARVHGLRQRQLRS